MAKVDALESELLELCRKIDGSFRTSNAPWLDRINERMGALAAANPEPAPMTSEQFDRRWKAEFRPPQPHSDVVFFDAEMRVNIGSIGDIYVISRTGEPALTAALSAA